MKKILLGAICASLFYFPSVKVQAKSSLKDLQEMPATNIVTTNPQEVLEKDHWAYKRLENITKKYGLMVGKPGELFDSGKPLTRSEAAILLVNLVGKIEKDNVTLSELEKEQIDVLKSELNGEIQKLSGRVATLEGRVSNLEDNKSKAWEHKYGEDFKLTGCLGFRYNGNFKKGSDNIPENFSVDDSALYIGGKLHKNIDYTAGFNFNRMLGGTNAANKIIDDAYIRTNIIPKHYVYLGQVRVPIGQEGSLSDIVTDNISKAQISRNFSDKRDVGVKLIGRQPFADYYIAAFNGAGAAQTDNDNTLELASWGMLKPFYKHPEWGTLELGGGYDTGKNATGIYNTTWGGYVGYKYKKFKISSEYARKDGYLLPNQKANGYYIRASYNLTKKSQLIATYDRFYPNASVDSNYINEYTLGGSYWLLSNLRFRYNYVHVYNRSARSSDRFAVSSTFTF